MLASWRPWWFDILLVAVVAATLPFLIQGFSGGNVLLVIGLILFVAGYLCARPRSLALVERTSTLADNIGAVLLIAGVVLSSYTSSVCSLWLAVACPILWLAIAGYRPAVVWNIVLILLTGAVLFAADVVEGTLAQYWPLDATIVVVPMIFSLMMGSMSYAALAWGKERAELVEELQASQADLAESYRRLMEEKSAGPAADESPLSAREAEVLTLVSRGCTNREIGNRLHISMATVKTHMEHILTKLGATTRTQAVLVAHQEGILTENDPS